MAVPKQKTSRSQKRKRRTHWKLKSPALTLCDCGSLRRPHCICPICNMYRGRNYA